MAHTFVVFVVVLLAASAFGGAPLVLTTPASLTIECGTSSAPTATGIATYTGTGCGLRVQLNYTDTIPNANTCNRFFLRTWTVVDGCGMEAVGTQTITIQDTTAPVITLVGGATVTLECGSSTAPSSTLGATAVDACGTQYSLTYSDSTPTAGMCGLLFSFTRTWTAIDACGNSASSMQMISTVDTTKPTLVIPQNHVFECASTTPPTLTAMTLNDKATANDRCTAPGGVMIASMDTVSKPCPSSGTTLISRAWTATDACTNAVTATQTITVTDTRPPALTLPSPVFTSECDQTMPIPPMSTPTVTVTDLCDSGANFYYNDTVVRQNCGNSVQYKRTFTGYDACGNKAQIVQTVNIVDTTPPVFTPPGPVTVQCAAGATALANTGASPYPTGTDKCSATVVVTYQDLATPGCTYVPSLKRTWTATDQCGLQTSGAQTITVQDTVAPTVTVPPALTLECAVASATFVPVLATATDACDPAPTISISTSNINIKVPGVYQRNWIATDHCAQASAPSPQTITVSDTTPPVLVLPPDIVVQCGQSTMPAATGTATAVDLCDPNPTVAPPVDVFTARCGNSGTIARTWTAKDASNNMVSKTQIITVVDSLPPVITVPAPVTVDCTASTTVASLGSATIVDACTPALRSMSSTDTVVSVGCGGNKEVTRVWYATDACGHTSSATQLIHIKSTMAPMVTPPSNIVIECGNSIAPVAGAAGAPTITSQCNRIVGMNYTDSVTAAPCGFTKTISRTFTAVDDCGLRSAPSAPQTITVMDTTPPRIGVTPATITAPCNVEISNLVNLYNIVVVANDTCSAFVKVTSSDATSFPTVNCGSGTLTRTYKAVDACGNMATATVVVTLVDNTPPVFSDLARASVSLTCSEDSSVSGPAGTLTATDTCSSVTVTSADTTAALPNAPACANNQVITRTWTAKDACNNAATFVQTITVRSTEPPSFTTFPADLLLECPAAPMLTQPTFSDKCAGTVTLSSTSTNTTLCGSTYIKFLTYRITNVCGLSSSRTQKIQFFDTLAPVISVSNPGPILCTTNYTAAALGGYSVADACDPNPVVVTSDRLVQSCGSSRIIERRITATDVCGHVSTATQRLNVLANAGSFTLQVPTANLVCFSSTAYNATGVGIATYTNPCTTPAVVTYNDIGQISSCGVGSITRTYTLNDGCNLPQTLTQTITLTDSPSLVIRPTSVSLQCNTTTGPLAPLVLPTALASSAVYNSSCLAQRTPIVTYRDVYSGTCSAPVITRTWTANDSCNPLLTTTQTINVAVAPPTFTFASTNISVACLAPQDPISLASVPVFNPSCGFTNATVSYSDNVATLVCGLGSYVRTWTANDSCQVITGTQTINVLGSVSFTVSNASITVQCNSTIPSPTYTHPCGYQPNITFVDSNVVNGCGLTKNFTRTWSASLTGSNCNTPTVVQNITIVDTTPPTFTFAPPNVTVVCGNSTAPAATGVATAADTCGTATVAVPVDTPSTTTVIGAPTCPTSITRVWTATDQCGNSATYTQTISLVAHPF